MHGAEGKSAQFIPVSIKVQVLYHIFPSISSCHQAEQGTDTQPVIWANGSPFPACSCRAQCCKIQARLYPRALRPSSAAGGWESSPAAAGDVETTGAGASSHRDMIHILRKGPHPPTRQLRSCFVEGKAPSAPQGCRSRREMCEQKSLAWGCGVRVAGGR